MEPLEYKRGEIYMAELDPVVGNEQSGYRPVLIVQNNTGNRFSPTVIVAVITSKKKKNQPTQVQLIASGMAKNSLLMAEHLRTLDKSRLRGYVGELDTATMIEVNHALKVSIGLKGIDISHITLCPQCAGLFYQSDCFYIRRIDRHPVKRARCQFCKQQHGFLYAVTFRITGS